MLYQHMLYERVPPARRTQLHRRIGARLEAAYRQDTSEVAAALAVHFVQGRDPVKAVAYLTQAANIAIRRFGYHEAILHLTQALSILHALPETTERDQQELFLQLTLFGPLIALKGYGAAAGRNTLDRARERSEKGGDTSLEASLLSASGAVATLRAELPAARAAGERALQLARTTSDSIQLTYASLTLGQALLYQGELIEAQRILSQGIALPHPPHYDPYGTIMDPWIACLSVQALNLGFRGCPDQGRACADEAVQHARQLDHPYTIAFALSIACTLRVLCGEHDAARALADAEIALAHEHGFSYFETLGRTLLGWSLMREGRRSEGTTLTRQGLATQRELEMECGRPIFLIFIAEALGNEGNGDEGLIVLEEAEGTMQRSGELLCEAPLYCIRGKLLLQRQQASARRRANTPRGNNPSEDEAEACLHYAIAVARRQDAKWLELYSANTLSRLWLQQGKKVQARQLLAELYAWFTEGFDTVDLQEAKALIDELSH
jgi:hypothetical protein